MSQLDISDSNDELESETNNNKSSIYSQLERYLSELETKGNDIYEKHKRLISDFQKSAILNLTNISESIQEESENLSRRLSSHSSSDSDSYNQILILEKKLRQINIKIMKSDISTLESDSNIIHLKTEKLLLDKEIFRKKMELNDAKIRFCNQKNNAQNAIMEINKNSVSLNETISNFNYDKMKFSSLIKRIQSEVRKLEIYLQNCEIKKQELQQNAQTTLGLSNQVNKLISTQNENNKMKLHLCARDYSDKIYKIRNKKEKCFAELRQKQNYIESTQRDEILLKKKMKTIKNKMKEEQNFENCLNSKLKKCNIEIEKSKKIVHNECELLNADLERIQQQIQKALSSNNNNNNSNNSNKQINNKTTIINSNQKFTDFNSYNLNDIEAYKLHLLASEKNKLITGDSEVIKHYQDELDEMNYENLLLKQKILSTKKKIIEHKIEYTEMEQTAAALLKASVEKQKEILINQEQREILHDDCVTDKMIEIQKTRAKIILSKASNESTSLHNKFGSQILNHVIDCSSTRPKFNKFIFFPENYVYLSQ